MRTSDPNARKIFRAMQKYGLIVADNGSDMYITGTFDTQWNNDILNPAFSTLTASDFEVIQLGWQPAAGAPALSGIAANPNQVVGGNPSTGSVTLTGAAPSGGVLVSLSSASSAVTVPASVPVAQGASTASFAITTSPVVTPTATSISASLGSVTKTASPAVVRAGLFGAGFLVACFYVFSSANGEVLDVALDPRRASFPVDREGGRHT